MSRRPSLLSARGLLALLAAILPAVAAASAQPATGAPRPAGAEVGLSYARIEEQMRARRLPIVAVEHSPKSEHASTLKLTLEGDVALKFRVSEDLSESRRNEDPKLFAASYVVSQLLVPDGGPVLPALLRSIPLQELLPHLDAEAERRMRAWARGGLVWGAISLYRSGGVRAEDSRFYGGHLGPSPEVDARALPVGFVHALGNLNIVATLTHNGDLHGDNWEIRESDGACFVIDSGISFVYDGVLPYQKQWRKPCDPLARAYAASTIERVREILRAPAKLEDALTRLQGTSFGIPGEARAVVLAQARELVACWDRTSKVEIRSLDLERLLRAGELAPFREHEEGPLYLVTDW